MVDPRSLEFITTTLLYLHHIFTMLFVVNRWKVEEMPAPPPPHLRSPRLLCVRTIGSQWYDYIYFIIVSSSIQWVLRSFIVAMTNLYPIYPEQKLSRSRSGLQSRLQSGSRSRRCTRLHRTCIVQYNKALHIVYHCSAIVTSQST